jgi:hypothetical protein
MSKEFMIDVAVLCQEYTQVDFHCNNANMIQLDPIVITEETFKHLFYPYGENFGLDKKNQNNKNLEHYITFLAPHRTLRDGKKFFLLDEIITNIESDLNISRNAFTTTSLIDLTNEISKIKTLWDLNVCSVLSSLPWSNIEHLLENDRIDKKPDFEESQKNRPDQLTLVVSVVFKTPTEGVRNTIIRFPYLIK